MSGGLKFERYYVGFIAAVLMSVSVRALSEGDDSAPSDSPKLFVPEADWPAGSDASPAFTPDGRTVFFTHVVGSAHTIIVSHLIEGRWSMPTVALFSGTWRDIEPAMAPDG